MSIVRVTSADILAQNNSEAIVGLISETIQLFPELTMIPASPVTKTAYKTLVKTANPTVGFRAENVGRETQKATLTTRDVTCQFLDASWDIDERQATECDAGVEAACAIQAQAHLEAAFAAIAIQTWYGVAADAAGFAGVASLHPNIDSPMVVNAGGATPSTGSSVFAVRFGPQLLSYCWGLNGRLNAGERVYTRCYDEAGLPFWGYAQALSGWCGLQITNYQATARIANLTEETDKGLTDDMIYTLLSKFPAGQGPNALFLSRRSLEQLRKSRQATNATGAPAPTPTDVQGVPLITTDSISNIETILTAAS